jgi:hypothetical protein
MDNPEKLATMVHKTQDTRRRQTKEKHNTICVRHHHTQANANKSRDLPLTTGGKDDSNILLKFRG